MTEKQAHIDAVFGGKQVRFRIRRENNRLIAIGLSISEPFAIFQKFALGNWTVGDLKMVLGVSYNDGANPYLLVVPKEVEDVLCREPPGVYVPLAVAILEAYLFGIEPERGTFDEKAERAAA